MLKRVAHAPQCSFFGGDRLFLPLNAGFFVVFALTQLGQNARFFAELFEATDSTLNGFVFSNSDSGHKLKSPPIPPSPLLKPNSN